MQFQSKMKNGVENPFTGAKIPFLYYEDLFPELDSDAVCFDGYCSIQNKCVRCEFCSNLENPSAYSESLVSRILEEIYDYSKSEELKQFISAHFDVIKRVITLLGKIDASGDHLKCTTLMSITAVMDELIREIAVWFLTHEECGIKYDDSCCTCNDECLCDPKEDYKGITELVNFILLQLYACLLVSEHLVALKPSDAQTLMSALCESELTLGEIVINFPLFPDAYEGFTAFCEDITTKKNACLEEIRAEAEAEAEAERVAKAEAERVAKAEAERVAKAEAEAKANLIAKAEAERAEADAKRIADAEALAKAKEQRAIEDQQKSKKVRSFLKNM